VKLPGNRVVVVETKGREDLDVALKMERLRQWCEDLNGIQKNVNYDFVFVDQEGFEKYPPKTFRQLLDGFQEFKGIPCSI
jgi:type III restriction enzyme